MTTLEKKPEGYITLKEASELFGYSPDYIGQLIRKGKIEGKQVYANVAWMTTRETLEEYLHREKKDSKQDESDFSLRMMRLLLSDQSVLIATWLLRALIPILVVVLLIVFYFVSISIDHKFSESAERELLAKTMQSTETYSVHQDSVAHFTYEK